MQFFSRLHKFGVKGPYPNAVRRSQLHEAAILGEGVQPAFKIAHFMAGQFGRQLFKDLHDRVFCQLPVLQVFEADAKEEVEVSLIQHGEDLQVPGMAVLSDKFEVGRVGSISIG